jgi:hypothetical protein
MKRAAIFLGCVLAAAALAACGGDDDDGGDATATPGASGTASNSATARPTGGDGTETSGSSGTVDETQATALLDEVLLTPVDLPGEWSIQTDTTTDNTAQATDDPEYAGSIERCGRLLGRTITNGPGDLVGQFIAGQTVSFFSTATVYETAEGAADCSAEATTRFQEPGELARVAFEGVFIDPDAVVVMPVEYPTVADGSFAATLNGQIDVNGSPFDLTILVVAFLSGNTTSAVGSARSGSVPPVEELQPYVDLVAERIAENQ